MFTPIETKKKRYFEYQKINFYNQNYFSKFKNISEEKRKDILSKVTLYSYLFSQNDEKIFQLYEYLNRAKALVALGIHRGDEVFLFFLLSMDPNLLLLQIYYEENDISGVKKRFQEEFDCPYEARLLTLEKYYNERFPTILKTLNKKI